MKYWLDTFTEDTWAEFVAAGSKISGFPKKRWRTVEQIEVGDIFICYVLGAKVFHAVLNTIGEPRMDSQPIWKSATYPSRVPVSVQISLPPEHGVRIDTLKNQLSWFQNLKTPSSWTFRLRHSPYEIAPEDAVILIAAIRNASRLKTPPTRKAVEPVSKTVSEPTHDEIQWLLLSLGSRLGLQVRPANNDFNKSYEGNSFSELKGLRKTLPVQFDQRTQRIIEHIDVLWLRGSSIVAAFEIEHSTSVYSGLLRMSDLIARQPNLNINLFVVAPDQRRQKVKSEVNRPTFSRFGLPSVCKYIAYSRLQNLFESQGNYLQYSKPEILDTVAEDMSK